MNATILPATPLRPAASPSAPMISRAGYLSNLEPVNCPMAMEDFSAKPPMSRCGSQYYSSPVGLTPTSLQPTRPMFYTYALGWDVQDYRGAKIVWHGGA